jgi:hypothetical protein
MADTLKEVVRVKLHMNGGFSRVIAESTEGLGIADGGIEWEIPTNLIPAHLRKIGSRFLLINEQPQSQDREHLYDGVRIEEIPR